MPRRRMMDYMMMRDGRNPYGSRGGYVSSRRMRRDRARGRDGLMMEDMRMYNRGESDYELSDLTRQNQQIRHDPYMPYDYASRGQGRSSGSRGRGRDRVMNEDYAYDRANMDYGTGEPYAGIYDFPYEEQDNARSRRDYESSRQYDMAGSDYAIRGRSRDGHYPMVQGYMPIEAMGRFTGYYGMGEDYARGRGRGRRDYAMDYNYGYGYDGEMLEDEDIMEWTEKLKKEVDDKDKAFFSKENIKNKATQMGIKFDKFSMEEFMLTTLMMYTDYCKTLGTANMDIYLRLAKDWLTDEDASVKYGEKLAAYYDNIVDAD